MGDFSWPEAILEGILEGKWQCSADEISFLDKVDGGEVVHQLEMIFVQCGRNLFGKKHKKRKKKGNKRLTKGKRSVLGRRARDKGLCC